MKAHQKRPSRIGSRGVAGLLAVIVPAVGFSFLTYRTTLEETGSSAAAWRDVGSIVLGAMIGTAVISSLVAVIRLASTGRERKLRTAFPKGLVYSSGSIPQLRDAATKALSPYAEGQEFPKLWYFSIVATEVGISIWDGWGQPREIGHLDWGDIVEIHGSTFEERGRSSNGIEVSVRQQGGNVKLPFVIVGAGFGGLFPVSSTRIDRIVKDILELRNSE